MKNVFYLFLVLGFISLTTYCSIADVVTIKNKSVVITTEKVITADQLRTQYEQHYRQLLTVLDTLAHDEKMINMISNSTTIGK